LSGEWASATIPIVNLFAYVSSAVVVVVVSLAIALRPWPFPPSLTSEEINGFVRQNGADPGRGTEALSTFYAWRQDIWTVVARGAGAFAVALLLALVGASLEAGKTVTTKSTGATAKANTKTVAETDSKTSPAVLALVLGLSVFAVAAWQRSRAVQREFAADVGRLH
jgi:hypothetical protein